LFGFYCEEINMGERQRCCGFVAGALRRVSTMYSTTA
jgi:hypothetical protein